MASTATPEARGGPALQQGAVGTGHIVFMILAAAAPIAAMVGVMPVGIALGDGAGFAGAYVVAGIVLLLFAVGYAAMSREVTSAGGFYSYVVAGLGPRAGAAAGYVALVAYNATAIALSAGFAFFAHTVMDAQFGIDLPWQAWWAIAVVIVALLGYRHIALTASVLGVALVCEVLVLLVFDVAVLANHGLSAFSLHVFAPATVFSGAVGIALMYAFSSFIGFEAAALYSEEAHAPKRTVARATYIGLGIVAIFYTLTTWAAISAYGADVAQQAAGRDPSTFVFGANFVEVSTFTTDVMQVLVVTSVFAGFLAFHQAAARYFLGLARDGLLPARLSAIHARHRSPYVASAVQLALVVLVVGVLALAGQDPYLHISAPILGLGTLGIILLQAAAAAGTVAYFRQGADARTWSTLVAPGLATLGLLVSAALAIHNFGTLTGSHSTLTGLLPWLYAVAAVLGIAVAGAAAPRQPASVGTVAQEAPQS